MKTPKSPENEEVTPSKKKLKQARLPFKIISDGSPKADTPPSRKRKLSAPEAEPVTKLGKVAKENNLTDEAVVISDDDSRDSSKVTKDPKEDKQVNPFVKLVDKARKKKLQKSKTSKKKRSGSKKSLSAGNSTDATENADSDSKVSETVESMEVDLEEDEDKLNEEGQEKEKSEENNDVVTDEAVVLLDSNHASVQDDRYTQNSTQEDAEKLDNVDENCHNKDDNISGDNESANEVVILEDSNQASEQDVISTQVTVHDQIKADHDDSAKVALGATSDNENSEDEKIDSDSEESEDKGDTSISVEKEIKNSDRDTSISITPKRSARNKQKEQSKLNSSQLSTGEESVSNPSTPRRSTRSSSVSKNQGDVSLNESSSANLTPKQLQKKLELAKKKEEREKEKQERDKKKQQEKDERAKQRLEKEEQRKREKEEKEEAKRKEREEKEEQKKKEREEREKQKEVEKKLKEEKEEQKRKEKEEKEEQRRKEKEAREEEKRKKQEALEQEKLEQEQKKKKAAEAFVNFFVPKQKVEKDQTTEEPVSKSSLLSSFTIKSDMRLAPTVRNNLTEEKRQYLDDLLTEQNIPKSSLYIHSLKEGVNKPLSCGKTWPMDDKDDDIMIVEDELPPMDGADEILTCDAVVREKLRPKLLSFHENRRPPYWGTWRKKSTHVKPRRPFTQDQKHLDYEVDSDEEWEEEQEGESIDGSAAGSDDDQDADEYEVDNELFVPHGYLSDEEATMDEDDVLSLSPETQKARLKHLEDEFESELKKPTEKLKPRMYGLLWETSDGSKPEKCVDALWNYFKKLAMIMNDPTPLLQPSSEPEEPEKKKVKKKKSLPDSDNQSPKTDKKKKRDNKEAKTSKTEPKKNAPEIKKNQPGINSFLTISKVKS